MEAGRPARRSGDCTHDLQTKSPPKQSLSGAPSKVNQKFKPGQPPPSPRELFRTSPLRALDQAAEQSACVAGFDTGDIIGCALRDKLPPVIPPFRT